MMQPLFDRRRFLWQSGGGLGGVALAWLLGREDLHATILHLLGVDHTKLTFRHNGIDRRLTDVHGSVIAKLLA